MTDISINPAEHYAQEALEKMCECIDSNKNFLLEAGAGSGKTYSLKYALKYLIQKRGFDFVRRQQQVACISYTNIASEQISNGIDWHPVIYSSTIHAFCWLLIRDYQPFMRSELPKMKNWSEKIEEAGGILMQSIGYDNRGFRAIDEVSISLHHDDVISFIVKLLDFEKFRLQLINRFPILLIDEYQDTNSDITKALITNFIDSKNGPLIGFFGDHWQKIYGSGCGKIESHHLVIIPKEANFRSVPAIVNVLNKMRPDLPQQVKEPTAWGSVAVYHTNKWQGIRRMESHWKGDLPAKDAHESLQYLISLLKYSGWDFSPDKTKILMLTHKGLAREQGYDHLAEIFKNSDAFIHKTDSYIKFFVDILEPVCILYKDKRFGEMFTILGTGTPTLRSLADKNTWMRDMDKLLELRKVATVGEVIDHLKSTHKPHLSGDIERKEQKFDQWIKEEKGENSPILERIEALKGIPYHEIVALFDFLNSHTPFETKHGVKGAEFENVLVVVGRGWNQYNFNDFLELAHSPEKIQLNKRDAFERNRNLFYVTCSRPTTRLAILFTQKLSDIALDTLANWFGPDKIKSLL